MLTTISFVFVAEQKKINVDRISSCVKVQQRSIRMEDAYQNPGNVTLMLIVLMAVMKRTVRIISVVVEKLVIQPSFVAQVGSAFQLIGNAI